MTQARTTDPITSHLAAAKGESSGSFGGQRAVCLEWVTLFPGMTAAELAKHAGLERHAPSRRLPELRKRKLIHTGEDRACDVTGNPSKTWYPGPGDEEQLALF